MTVIFADTFYLLALVNPNDRRHQQALAFSAAFAGKMITTCWVITEAVERTAPSPTSILQIISIAHSFWFPLPRLI
jgi:hypothetical protein